MWILHPKGEAFSSKTLVLKFEQAGEQISRQPCQFASLAESCDCHLPLSLLVPVAGFAEAETFELVASHRQTQPAWGSVLLKLADLAKI